MTSIGADSPGSALSQQRAAAAFQLGSHTVKRLLRRKSSQNLASLLLIAGLWTPVAGIVAASAEAWVAFSAPAHAGNPAALALLGVMLALAGPGQWSVDARLYGRKHFAPPEL